MLTIRLGPFFLPSGGNPWSFAQQRDDGDNWMCVQAVCCLADKLSRTALSAVFFASGYGIICASYYGQGRYGSHHHTGSRDNEAKPVTIRTEVTVKSAYAFSKQFQPCRMVYVISVTGGIGHTYVQIIKVGTLMSDKYTLEGGNSQLLRNLLTDSSYNSMVVGGGRSIRISQKSWK